MTPQFTASLKKFIQHKKNMATRRIRATLKELSDNIFKEDGRVNSRARSGRKKVR